MEPNPTNDLSSTTNEITSSITPSTGFYVIYLKIFIFVAKFHQCLILCSGQGLIFKFDSSSIDRSADSLRN